MKEKEITDESTIEKLSELGIGLSRDARYFLNIFEQKYCEEKDILKGKSKLSKNEELIYSVFKTLREKGYICRFSKDSDLIRVYQKGFRPGEDRTRWVMKVINGKWPDEKDASALLQTAKKMRKEAVFALADKEITFYKISSHSFD
ncbi:hypothetical protein JXB01_03985 [Candidatus Micrarchaeota archaeon]|nr:hypothetical protein [Candidatus Micrarchaeota archaeon]